MAENGPIDIMSNTTVSYEQETDIKNENIENEKAVTTDEVETPVVELKVYTEQEYNELYDKYIRQAADFDNYIKRTNAQINKMQDMAGRKFLETLIPAMNNVYASVKNSNDEGPSLIFKVIEDAFKKAKVEIIIPKVGDQFDSDTMHAIATVPAPDESADNTIVDVISPGYTIAGIYVEFPKVIVYQA